MQPQKPSPAPAEISPLSFARMIWKGKIPAVLIAMSLAVVVVVVVQRLPPIYKAEAMILVDSQKIPERYVSSTVSSDVGDRLATISQQILSSAGLKKVITDFDLYREERKRMTDEEILEKIRKDIDIKLEKGWSGNRPPAFHVGYQGRVPETVAGVANRIANLFVEENLRTREVQAEGTAEFIVNQLQEAKKKLDELELAVSGYKLQHNGELPQQENALMGALARLQLESQANQEAMNRAQQNKVMLENALTVSEAAESAEAAQSKITATGKAPADGPSTLAGDPATPREIHQSSEMLEAQLEILRARYNDDYPDVRRLKAEISQVRVLEEKKDAKTQKAALKTDQEPTELSAKSGTDPLAPKPAPPTSPVTQMQARISAIKAQLTLSNEELQRRAIEHDNLQKETADVESSLHSLPVREQEMAGLTRDYEISKANYRTLLDKKLAADMATEMERRQKAERFTVVDPARVPEKPFSPNRPLFNGLGIALSVAIGIAFGIGREYQRGVLLGEWEIPEGITLLGRVPRIHTRTPVNAGTERPQEPGRMHREDRVGFVSTGFSSITAPVLKLWRSSRDV